MSPAEIRKHQRAEPFIPFRLHVSDGSSYDVREPYLMVISDVLITIGVGPLKDGIPRSSVYIQPLHITSLETLNEKRGGRSSNGNGSSKH